MSANNFLAIKEYKNTQFRLRMKDADTGAVLDDYGVFPTLKKAIQRANEVQGEEIVEYGLYCDIVSEK